MTSPSVSIVVPAYNHASYIEQALDSVAGQTHRPLEVVVIDDGSTDGTGERARRFAARWLPSAVVIERPNRGAAFTINQGIALTRGDYINILNSDDYFAPERIAACAHVATGANRELIFTGVRFVDDSGADAPEDEYLGAIHEADRAASDHVTLGFALMHNQLAVSTGNLFFSRRLYDRVGPFRPYHYVHDWDFLLRCLFYAEPFRIPDALYHYRLHGSNSFKTLGDVAGYETTEVMRNFLYSMVSRLPENPRAPSPHYWPYVFERHIRKWNYHPYLPPRHQSALSAGQRVA